MSGLEGGAEAAPRARLLPLEQGAALRLGGEWSVSTLPECRAALIAAFGPGGAAPDLAGPADTVGPAGLVDLGGITRLDTAGGLLLNEFFARFAAEGRPRLENCRPEFLTILDISRAPPELTEAAPPPAWKLFLHSLGAALWEEALLLAGLCAFFGEFSLRAARRLRRPASLFCAPTIHHLEQAGIRALPIVCLLNFLIGLVIAYMAAASLAMFGARIYVVNLLEVVTLREMAVLITSILVAGRSGSSFTAQIGVMLSNQEVDAMRVLGLDPLLELALPRTLALFIALPCLVVAADIMSLLGGLTAAWLSMGISPASFLSALRECIQAKHIVIGLAKAPVFALVIACVGCFLGFQVKGGADAVGRLTTRSVVESIFLVILLDALFALLFSLTGI